MPLFFPQKWLDSKGASLRTRANMVPSPSAAVTCTYILACHPLCAVGSREGGDGPRCCWSTLSSLCEIPFCKSTCTVVVAEERESTTCTARRLCHLVTGIPPYSVLLLPSNIGTSRCAKETNCRGMGIPLHFARRKAR